jgi:hypothetical protein
LFLSQWSCGAVLIQALGEDAWTFVPLTFCLPEEHHIFAEWLTAHPEQDTGLWMLKTGQDAGKGLRLVRTEQ